jgi:hypothetical protein
LNSFISSIVTEMFTKRVSDQDISLAACRGLTRLKYSIIRQCFYWGIYCMWGIWRHVHNPAKCLFALTICLYAENLRTEGWIFIQISHLKVRTSYQFENSSKHVHLSSRVYTCSLDFSLIWIIIIIYQWTVRVNFMFGKSLLSADCVSFIIPSAKLACQLYSCFNVQSYYWKRAASVV